MCTSESRIERISKYVLVNESREFQCSACWIRRNGKIKGLEKGELLLLVSSWRDTLTYLHKPRASETEKKSVAPEVGDKKSNDPWAKKFVRGARLPWSQAQ